MIWDVETIQIQQWLFVLLGYVNTAAAGCQSVLRSAILRSQVNCDVLQACVLLGAEVLYAIMIQLSLR
jgi:hypothetical protein